MPQRSSRSFNALQDFLPHARGVVSRGGRRFTAVVTGGSSNREVRGEYVLIVVGVNTKELSGVDGVLGLAISEYLADRQVRTAVADDLLDVTTTCVFLGSCLYERRYRTMLTFALALPPFRTPRVHSHQFPSVRSLPRCVP